MLPRAHHQFCIAEAGQVVRFNVELITVEVGCRVLIDTTQFSELGAVLELSQKGISQLFTNIIRTTALESYTIWCCRNIHTYLLSFMPAVLFFQPSLPFLYVSLCDTVFLCYVY